MSFQNVVRNSTPRRYMNNLATNDEQTFGVCGASSSWEERNEGAAPSSTTIPLPRPRTKKKTTQSVDDQKIPLLDQSSRSESQGTGSQKTINKIKFVYGSISSTSRKTLHGSGGGDAKPGPRSRLSRPAPAHRRVQSLDEKHAFLRSGPSVLLKDPDSVKEEEQSKPFENTPSPNRLSSDVVHIASVFTNDVLKNKHHRRHDSAGLPPFSPSKASNTSIDNSASTSPAKKSNLHRRTSSESGLPSSMRGGPKKYTIPKSPSRRGLLSPEHSRSKLVPLTIHATGSYDEEMAICGVPSDVSKPTISSRHKTHSRNDSLTSIGSVASAVSVKSDITKSIFFRGISESGHIQFSLPLDNVRLIMDPNLHSGVLCKTCDDDNLYDEYNNVPVLPSNYQSDDVVEMLDHENCYFEPLKDASGTPLSPVTSNLQAHPLLTSSAPPKRKSKAQEQSKHTCAVCQCNCRFCTSCSQKTVPLPHNHYLLTVEHDLYRRVISEIADSQNAPCGLFFCGHHEDVHRPSIYLAFGIVLFVLAAMFACTLFWAFD